MTNGSPRRRGAGSARTARSTWSALLAGLWLGSGLAFGQAAQRAAFVANNGNLEGSVTSFTFNPDGSPHFVTEFNTGTNPQTISLSPNGKYLATAHGTASDTVEELTIMRVAADATLTLVDVYYVQDSPLDIEWVTDEYLAVTRTYAGGSNRVDLHRFDPAVPSLTLVDQNPTGTFTVYLAVHPSRKYVYGADSGASPYAIYAYSLSPSGLLELIESQSTASIYPLGMCTTRDGTKLYSTGGISSSGNKVHGYAIADGALTALAGSPFISPGSSPKDVTVSSDDTILFVGHGTDATVRSFFIDAETGALTYTGYMFDVGLQGTLGDLEVLDELLLVTDESTAIDGIRGLYSFTVHPDGSFTQNGAIVDTLGVTPESIAVWSPGFPVGDLNCDDLVNAGDIPPFVLALTDRPAYEVLYPDCPADEVGDVDGDGSFNSGDIPGFVDLLTGGG